MSIENQLHLVTTMSSRKGNNYLTFNGRQNMRNEIIRGVPLSEITSKFNVSYRTVLREKENIRLGTELPTGIGKERKKVQSFHYNELESYLSESIDSLRMVGFPVSGAYIQILARNRARALVENPETPIEIKRKYESAAFSDCWLRTSKKDNVPDVSESMVKERHFPKITKS